MTPVLHVVPHTHWDREWYLSAAATQLRLAALVDDLLDRMQADTAPPSFLLDGQAVTLDDYVAVRPARAAALRRALADGRLEVGPWHVLADELLVSAEALIRNLAEGARTVRRHGGRPMAVGYSPDAFGHSGALPTILAGFGLTTAVVWRGYGGGPGEDGDVVRWRAADGSEVLLLHLPRVGYECGANLPVEPGAAAERWRTLRGLLGPRARTPHWLVLNGADHHALQRDLAAAVAALVAAAPEADVRLSSLEAYAEAVRRARPQGLGVVTGELVAGRRHAWALTGTHGTRLRLKQANAECQRLLERRAEPLAALAHLAGCDLREDLHAAWRTLLENHPHDSICGTSTDGVHREMAVRFNRCRDQGIEVIERALDALTGADRDEARRRGRSAWAPALLVVNPQARAVRGLVEAEVALFRTDVRVGQQGPRRPAPARRPGLMRLVGPDGRVLPVQELERRDGTERLEAPRLYPDTDLVQWRRVLVAAPVLPLGVTPLCVEEGRGRSRAAAEAPEPVRACGHGLDNGRLRLRVEADGTVAISERGSGRSAHGLGGIVDERDLGDSYTPSPRGVLAREPDTVAVRVVHAGPLRGELEVVRRWDRVALTLTTRVRLDADAQHVVLDSEGVNGQDDHRLRAVFPLGERMTRVVADGHFGPVERAPARGRTRRAAGELEAAPPTAPMQRWVAVAGRTRGLAVLTDGLPQCEARAGGELLVTLLRACGELSRADLPERPGHAGWPTPTPEGQCRGPFRARLAVVLCDPAALDDATPIESAAEAFLAPPWALMRRWLLRVPPPVAGPALHGHGLVVSAVKPAESGDGVVLRCYNATAGAVEGVWHVPWPLRDAVRCRLDESALEPLSAERGVVRFTAAPRAVVTIRVRSG